MLQTIRRSLCFTCVHPRIISSSFSLILFLFQPLSLVYKCPINGMHLAGEEDGDDASGAEVCRSSRAARWGEWQCLSSLTAVRRAQVGGDVMVGMGGAAPLTIVRRVLVTNDNGVFLQHSICCKEDFCNISHVAKLSFVPPYEGETKKKLQQHLSCKVFLQQYLCCKKSRQKNKFRNTTYVAKK